MSVNLLRHSVYSGDVFEEHFLFDEIGMCSCGAPVRKIFGSDFTDRSDAVRYEHPDDTEGWCMYRCHSCHALIEEIYIQMPLVDK